MCMYSNSSSASPSSVSETRGSDPALLLQCPNPAKAEASDPPEISRADRLRLVERNAPGCLNRGRWDLADLEPTA